jgi:hypothetical protein
MRLFLFLFVLFLVSLSSVTAVGVAVAIKFFHADAAAWTNYAAWNSRPVLAGAVVSALSFSAAAALSFAWGVLTRLVRGNKDKQARKKARPQSNRRTTV